MTKWLKRILWGGLILVVVSVIYVAIADSGTLSVHYADSKTPAHQQLKTSLERWGGFDVAVQELDAYFLLPKSVEVWFTDCGQVNAFYDGNNSRVLMCYELVRDLQRTFRGRATSDSGLWAAVWQSTFFVFYHEIGHALIHILDLPVTGREEDVVDQLATVVLLNGGDAGRDAALHGAASFWINATRGRRTAYSDQHSLDQQRYFNILCWVYGSNPQAHQELLGRNWGLPRKRAENCEGEYQRMSRAWSVILEEHTM